MIDPDINIHGDNISTYKWLGNKGIENYNNIPPDVQHRGFPPFLLPSFF